MTEKMDSIIDAQAVWDVSKIASLFTKGATAFANLKSSFSETINILQNLISSLQELKTSFQQEDSFPESTKANTQEITKELSLLIEQVHEFNRLFDEDLIKPLDDFAASYARDSSELIQRSQKIMRNLKVEKERIEEIRKEYFHRAELLDKFQEEVTQALDSSPESDIIKTSKGKMRELRRTAYQAYQYYSHAVSNGNILVKDYENHFFSLIESIEITEQCRNDYYKQAITKYLAQIDKLTAVYTQKTKLIKRMVPKMGLSAGLKAYFEDSLQSARSPFLPLSCDNYNFMSPTLEMASANFDFPRKDPNEVNSLQDDEYFTIEFKCSLAVLFNKLKQGLETQAEDIKDVLDHLCTSRNRHTFSLFLDEFSDDEMILGKAQCQILMELCSCLLSKFLGEENPDTLISLLEASRKIVVKTEEVRQPFYLQLVNHKIWQEIDLWRRLIDFSINTKLQSKPKQQPTGLLSVLTKVKATVSGVSRLIPEDRTELKKATLDMLQRYCYYLGTPRIELRKVSELYMSYVKEFATPRAILEDLVTRLMRCQKNPLTAIKWKDVHLSKFRDRCKKYETVGCFALSLAVEYLDERIVLRNVLLLSKYLYRMLRRKVFRQVLVKLNLKVSLQQKLHIWMQILDIVIVLKQHRTTQ
eukprot:TRINITY_DN8378_c0_g9_i1.p1 TRINITY_DN8378_c0_g9~~TRINITY_DN8378_c0_g9_i1.p1  ORF type:complete len:644 (+),score=106.19 TRINITY_DN8378_c0_g9_i1:111-2042(+)